MPEMIVWPVSVSSLTRERGVFLDHLAEREVQPLFRRRVVGFDRLRDHRLVRIDPLEQDRRLRIAQRVAGGRIFEPRDRHDLAGDRLLEALALLRVNAEQARDFFFLVRSDIQDLAARFEHAAEDPHEHDLAALVHRDLERERRQRLGVLRLARQLLGGVARIDAGDGRHVDGRRQVIDHRVEQRVDALVAQRRTAEHGDHPHRDRRFANRGFELGLGQRGALEILLGNGVVEIRDRLDHLIARICGRGSDVVRDLDDGRRVGDIAGEHDRLHRHEIDDPRERVLAADHELDRHRVAAEALANIRDDGGQRRPDAIELVDEREARNLELVGLMPDRLRLRLNACDAAEHHDRTVEDAQRALDLDREVDVARRVDEMDLVLLPLERDRGRRDGDAALALLLHPVHLGLTVVDLADLVDLARMEEEPFRHGGLARVDMRDHAEIADQIDLRHRYSDARYSANSGRLGGWDEVSLRSASWPA